MGDMATMKTAFVYNEASASTTAASQLNANGIKG